MGSGQRLATAISFCCIVWTFLACDRDGFGYRLFDETSFGAEQIRWVEGKTGIPLPAGSVGLNLLQKEMLDPAFIAKIRIPESGDAAMRQTLRMLPKAKSVAVYTGLPSKVDWWKPAPAAGMEALFIGKPAGNSEDVRLFYCNEHESRILYVHWFLMN